MSHDFPLESGEQNFHNETDDENDHQMNSSDSEKAEMLMCSEDGDDAAHQPLIYLDDDTLKLNEHIEERIRNLQKTMLSLKSALTEEKEAWSREIEDMTQLYQHNECDYEPFVADSETDTNYYPELTVSESVMDYEQKLSMYQRTLKAAQYGKRYQLRRQLAASAYKKRLLEVENLCNLELLRVKQSVQFLQPLQQLASEWDSRHSESSGDGNIKFSFDDNSSNILSSLANIQEKQNKLNDEPSTAAPIQECIGSIIYDEMTKLAMAINKPVNFNCKTKESALNTKSEESTITAAASTNVQSQSAVWCNDSNNADSSTSSVISLP